MVCLKSHCFENVLNVFAVNSGPLAEMTTFGVPCLETGVSHVLLPRRRVYPAID